MSTVTAVKSKRLIHPPMRTNRPPAMEAVVKALQDKDLSLSWLAGQLGLRRASVCAWNEVPDEHVPFVSEVTGLEPGKIRPDRAKIYCPKDKKK